MQFDHLNSNENDGLMSIEDLRALRLRKKKNESDKKARKYILLGHWTLPHSIFLAKENSPAN